MRIVVKQGSPASPLRIEGLHYQTEKPVSVYQVGGTIVEIKNIAALPRGSENIYLAPGLIDNQVNGFANVDFSGDDLTPEGVLKATEAMLKEGVTTFMPTLITNSHQILVNNFTILDEACRKFSLVEACIAGFHLEGPYISPVDGFRGCHPAEHVRKPSWNEFEEFRKASGGRIIQVTVAPEIDGAQEFIKKCSSEGIIVAIGHSNASSGQVREAVENGARLSTHLGNGCANMIHRHNNPLWPQLDNDNLTATIIADGNHLLPEEIRVFLRAKGKDKVILTSDVVYLAGMAPGNYTFSGMNVILKEDGTLLNAGQNVLAGASFPLRKGVENIMKFTGMPLKDAVSMASENVARIYNLKDRGTIAAGNKADLVLIEKEGEKLKIKQTYKDGIPY